MAEFVGILQKMVDMQQQYLSNRESARGSVAPPVALAYKATKTVTLKAFFTFRPVHAPDEHASLTELFPQELLRDLRSSEEEKIVASETSVKDRCAAVGRAPTVMVKGYLGCARLKSFKSPQDEQSQHSYCVTSKTDMALERISENMKLSAELAFDYLVALSSTSDEQMRGVMNSEQSESTTSLAYIREMRKRRCRDT